MGPRAHRPLGSWAHGPRGSGLGPRRHSGQHFARVLAGRPRADWPRLMEQSNGLLSSLLEGKVQRRLIPGSPLGQDQFGGLSCRNDRHFGPPLTQDECVAPSLWTKIKILVRRWDKKEISQMFTSQRSPALLVVPRCSFGSPQIQRFSGFPPRVHRIAGSQPCNQ